MEAQIRDLHIKVGDKHLPILSLSGGNQQEMVISKGLMTEPKIKIICYTISGVCVAWVGMINTAQLSAAHPKSGDGREMNAIAATVLDGTSIAGGSGTIVGTIVGAFVIDQTQRNLQAKMVLQVRNENK